ncbi:hypothetical protein [Paludisphaera rhizosphaerae]|uniref:hypothetical protein n=1 Tax=Paludisphaera rhizosphaerae TaxID=2711216 RepID=UPI0013EA2579|nr:hypothetical protein [Paludisphaera rhizosphaerae]
MFIDRDGEGVATYGLMKFDRESVERARDVAMVAMHRQGVPLRVVGQFFGLPKSTAGDRIRAAEARGLV